MNITNDNSTDCDLSYLYRTGDHKISFDNGHILIKCPSLVAKVTDHLLDVMVRKGLTKQRVPDLVRLHQYVDYSLQLERDGKIKKASEIMDNPDTGLSSYFLQLIGKIRETIGIDFFHANYPTFRFHFPVPTHKNFITEDGRSLWIHNDVMIGQPPEAVNCWVALTDCKKTNTLYISNLDGSLKILREFCSHYNLSEDEYYSSRFKFKDLMEKDRSFYEVVYRHCKPRIFEKGDVLMFDSRCLHGPVENTEINTRLSIDFRIITCTDLDRVKKYPNPELRARFLFNVRKLKGSSLQIPIGSQT